MSEQHNASGKKQIRKTISLRVMIFDDEALKNLIPTVYQKQMMMQKNGELQKEKAKKKNQRFTGHQHCAVSSNFIARRQSIEKR